MPTTSIGRRTATGLVGAPQRDPRPGGSHRCWRAGMCVYPTGIRNGYTRAISVAHSHGWLSLRVLQVCFSFLYVRKNKREREREREYIDVGGRGTIPARPANASKASVCNRLAGDCACGISPQYPQPASCGVPWPSGVPLRGAEGGRRPRSGLGAGVCRVQGFGPAGGHHVGVCHVAPRRARPARRRSEEGERL